jgi:hypothetical protein
MLREYSFKGSGFNYRKQVGHYLYPIKDTEEILKCGSKNMKNSSFAYWFQGKTGRLILSFFPVIFVTIFGFDFIRSGDLIFYSFLLYTVVLCVLIYKIWGLYYKFTGLYRKKFNPDFPLTNLEVSEFFEKNPMSFFHYFATTPFLIWRKYADKDLALYASKLKRLYVLIFALPFIWFILIVTYFMFLN